MNNKLLVTALALLFISIPLNTNAQEGTTYNTNTAPINSPKDLNLGGSFIGQGSPNIVTRPVSLNIDGLTNAGDAFNILNRGDGRENFTRKLDSVEYLTNDDYIQNSIQFNRARQAYQQQKKQEANYSNVNNKY